MINRVKQPEDFPDIANVYLISEPGKNAIPIYSYKNDTFFLQLGRNKYVVTPFYIGAVPRCIGEEHFVVAFLFSSYKLPINSVVEAKPIYFVKFVLETVINAVVFVLPNEKIEVSVNDIKKFLEDFFGLKSEEVIVESEYKAKAFLIQSHKKYEKI